MLKKIFKLSGFKISVTITLIFVIVYGHNFLGFGSGSFLDLLDKQVIDIAMKPLSWLLTLKLSITLDSGHGNGL